MMKRFAPLILLLAGPTLPVFAATGSLAAPPSAPQPAAPKTHLKVGQPAPDFTPYRY